MPRPQETREKNEEFEMEDGEVRGWPRIWVVVCTAPDERRPLARAPHSQLQCKRKGGGSPWPPRWKGGEEEEELVVIKTCK